jgi:DNA-binding NarL/FixJ family response regulator
MPDEAGDRARRVVLVEDEPLIRALMDSVLAHAGFVVRGVATAAEAVGALAQFDPDAVVVDLDLGDGPGGAEVLAYAERVAPWVALVVLTNAPRPAVVGVDSGLIPRRAAYLHKRSLKDAGALVDTLEQVLHDQRPRRDDAETRDPLSSLSRDQLEVLRLVAAGLSNAEIGARRGTSAHGVEQIVQRLITRLGVARSATSNPRVQLARLYYSHGPSPK